MSKLLTEQNFIDAASGLNIEVAAIKAVAEVESKGDGFLSNGLPIILYEPFIFGNRTNHKYDGATVDIGGVLYPLSLKGKWSPSAAKYGKYSIQYDKLEAAKKLDLTAALQSCSWGKFQVMGFNAVDCGWPNVEKFTEDMYKDENEHLKAFLGFVKANKLVKHLQNKDWAAFAKAYNGAGYAQNKYDIKLKEAYEKYAKQAELPVPEPPKVNENEIPDTNEPFTFNGGKFSGHGQSGDY